MIKPEKSLKIRIKPQNFPKNPEFPGKTLNFREKSPKPPKNLPARFARRLEGGGLPAAKLGVVFSKKIFSGGYFGYTPLAMSVLTHLNQSQG